MPASDDVHDRVATIVAETFAIPRDEVVADLGYGVIESWDSVGHLDLLLALERSFGFQMTADLIPPPDERSRDRAVRRGERRGMSTVLDVRATRRCRAGCGAMSRAGSRSSPTRS